MPTTTRKTRTAHATRASAERAARAAASAPPSRLTVGDALVEWEKWNSKYNEPTTVHTQMTMLYAWLSKAKLLKKPVCKITYEDVDAWVNAGDGRSLSTLNARLASARSLFFFCQEQSYITGNPAKLARINYKTLPIENQRPKVRRAMTEKEYRKLVDGADDSYSGEAFLRSALILSYWTGLRLTDCAQLQRQSILKDEIVVRTDKTETLIALPLNHPLIGHTDLHFLLLDLPQDHPRWVFPDARKILLDPRRRNRFSTYFARLCERVGVEGIVFHSARHAFKRRLDQAGVKIEDIGRMMGHSSTKTTEGYGRA